MNLIEQLRKLGYIESACVHIGSLTPAPVAYYILEKIHSVWTVFLVINDFS